MTHLFYHQCPVQEQLDILADDDLNYAYAWNSYESQAQVVLLPILSSLQNKIIWKLAAV